ncbi:MAG: crossover junction endodeoxyribonuclease RuvC [Endomicrobium sp.]|jgi:crossover junction endodeoxyribonuclease RuvC|nr:crossover junction endodeoxyribonuclease RuvC [Endomicrobium sp.]
MIVLGVDPGLSFTGWGIVETFSSRNKINIVKYGCIKTTSHISLVQRLSIINTELQYIIDTYRPEVVAIEELFFLKAAKSVAAVGQARGAIVLTIALNKVHLFEYNPKLVKIALTGYGSANKHQIQYMIKTLLKLNEIPKPDDAADALAVAICHINTVKF